MWSCDQSLITQFYKDLTRESAFFEGWSWFKFNNLGLALGMNLKFHTSVAKGLKLKVKKFYGLVPTFVEVAGEKMVGKVPFCSPPPILNRVNVSLEAIFEGQGWW